jgi:putative PIN family toxin of toxin-antitoxin system
MVLNAGLSGAFEIVVSQRLLDELDRALGYPKLRARITADEASELVDFLGREGMVIEDPNSSPTVRSPESGDDYLIALAAEAHALIVSGDEHLLGLADRIPVFSPASFLGVLEAGV